jgi:serine protease
MSNSSKASGVSRQRLNSLIILQLVFLAACLLSRPALASDGGLVGPAQFIPQLPKHDPGQIIVRFKQDAAQDVRDQIIAQHNCFIIRTCESADVHLLSIPESETAENIVDRFFEHDAVEFAELNYIVRVFLAPDDPYFHFQWNFYNGITGGIQMEEAWSIETGDPNVIVAVLDTGAAYENYDIYKQAPDLAETLFVQGYDFINDDNHPNDDHGHGTHVIGTIAQSTNNDIGVAGIAYGCSIMPVKVLDANGAGDYFTLTEGIYYAVDNGAMVINMSLGSTSPSNTLENALAYAYQNGVTVVCAAGNDYSNGNPVEYPAAYDDYCIAVGATRFDNQRAPYSSTGSYVDVVAPGATCLSIKTGTDTRMESFSRRSL